MISASKTVPMCIMLIANNVSRFTVTKRKAAEYILANYERVLALNVNELANEAESSPSTIIRLCNDLGYKRYQDLKITLAQEISHPTYQISGALEKTDDLETIVKKTFQSNIEAIESTLPVLDFDQFRKAVSLIVGARRLECYGIGGSAAVALDAAHKLLKIGYKAVAIS
ncbi:MAG: MurR/RpiR family transcriptional regulator, partial [Treponemataceae bacterium]